MLCACSTHALRACKAAIPLTGKARPLLVIFLHLRVQFELIFCPLSKKMVGLLAIPISLVELVRRPKVCQSSGGVVTKTSN